MLSTLLRIAREGSLLVAVGVALLSSPLAHAQPREREGRRDATPSVSADRGPGALELGSGLVAVFDPRHDLGKLALGGLLFGLAPMAGFIPPPVGIAAAVVIGAVGLGLMSWGMYNINKVVEAPTPSQPTPGNTNGGTTTSPGNAPGNGNGGSTENGGRGIPTRVDPPGGIDLGNGRGGSNVSRNDDTTLPARIPGRPSRTSSGTGGGATR